MPSKENKNIEADTNVVEFKPNKPKGKEPAKPAANSTKAKKSFTPSQIITVIILALLAIVLILGGVLPSFISTRTGGDSILFGKYDGTPIEFKNGNYFHRQYSTLSRQTNDTSINGMYQVWYNSYQNTIFHTALTKMAKTAGIVVAEDTLKKAIIDSGAYNKDGVFDAETYKNSTIDYQKQISTSVEENLPAQMVIQDITTVLTPAGEIDYIVAMSDNARTFEYVTFDSSLYPDDLTQVYAQANLALFTLVDVSILTMAEEEALKTVAAEIANGSTSFADAALANSIDGFASEGGRAGVFYLYELQDNFTEPEQVNILYSTQAGSVSQVFASPSGYTLYQVERAPWIADFSDPEVLSDVKRYIGQKDSGVLTGYLEEQAQLFAEVAEQKDFAIAAGEKNLETISVPATPANVGNSSYLGSFAYTDYNGPLASLSQNSDVMKELYTAPIGSVTGPYTVGSSFLVTKITGEEAGDAQMGEYLKMVYPYYSQSQAQQDLAMSVFASDKLEDNFFEVFFDKIWIR